jgi:hypothetical protein
MASSLVGVTMMAWGLMHSRPTLYNRSSSASSNIFIKRSTFSFGDVLNTCKTFFLNILGCFPQWCGSAFHITLMRITILIFDMEADPGYQDDADPGYQNNADPQQWFQGFGLTFRKPLRIFMANVADPHYFCGSRSGI